MVASLVRHPQFLHSLDGSASGRFALLRFINQTIDMSPQPALPTWLGSDLCYDGLGSWSLFVYFFSPSCTVDRCIFFCSRAYPTGDHPVNKRVLGTRRLYSGTRMVTLCRLSRVVGPVVKDRGFVSGQDYFACLAIQKSTLFRI